MLTLVILTSQPHPNKVRFFVVVDYRHDSRLISCEMALFTAENAAEMAKRAAEAKLAAKEQTKLAALSPEVEADFAERHRKLRLLRVRKQQERVDQMLLVETDPAKLDRLASAAIRLNEQERQLSNRSLPPTLKASQVRTKKSNSSAPEPE